MKYKITLVFIIITIFCKAQIVTIPDANFKAKLLSASASNTVASAQTPNILGFVSTYTTIDTNNNGEIEQSEAALIKYLNVSNSSITDLIGIANFTNLITINCENNSLTIFDVTQNLNLKYLFCNNSQLTSLNVTQNINLLYLYCEYNQLITLNINQNPSLQNLGCSGNSLTALDVTQNPNLEVLYCPDNQLTVLDVTQNPNLVHFSCDNNQLTSLNVTQNPNLTFLYCNYNQLTTLDVTQNPNFAQLWCTNNQLTSLFIKNNNLTWVYLYFSNNPNLQYICADEEDVAMVQQKIVAIGYTNCHVNTYCSFTPGGTFYTIEGNSKYDFDNNGCDVNDIIYPNMKFTITDGTNTGSIYSNTYGNYSIPVQAGSYMVTPVLQNPSYYNVSPTSITVNFPTQTSPLVQNFCVTPNGIHHDVEVVIMPTNPARPGFDTNYTILYKNKGNQVENGAITLNFNDAILDLVSANPTFSSQVTNSLTWNYTNLQPFETRTINLVFNINSQTETPAVNIGDQLNYAATITPTIGDEFLYDNYSDLKQIVVGSYDPNDKTCIEGTTVGPNMIGQYVHYVIRFENTGTYPAENIVVKDLIDLAKFDINTLIPLHSSHDFVTRINGNKVEFIFENINLPFDNATNDGYVSFKIKTKPTLTVGNTFSNNASIYFDYNYPILTNTFISTIQTLGINEISGINKLSVYPNPVKDILFFKTNSIVTKVEVYDISGRVLSSNAVNENKVNLSGLKTGNYILKVYTESGITNTKIIKE